MRAITMSQIDDRWRKEILVTLEEIRLSEAWLFEHGANVIDESEWLELRDIVARIERKLGVDK